MKPKSKWFLSIAAGGLVALLAAAVWWYSAAAKEPIHDGKTLSEWLAMGSKASRDNPAPEAARAAVRALGIQAIPFLEARLHSKKSQHRLKIQSLLRRIGLRQVAGRPPNNDELSEALFGFEVLGEAGVSSLRGMLNSSDRSVRHHALLALARLGTNAVTAVPDLGGLVLNDSVAFLRATAADTLGAIGSSEAIVPPLARALKDADDSVRLHAALALGRFDEVGVLEQDMNTYMNLRWNGRFDGSTVASRGGIDPAAISAIPGLREALGDPNPNVGAAARFALEQIEAAGAKTSQP